VGWLLSALGVFFRDIAQITTFVSLVVLYASAVFFSPTAVQATSPELWTILRWNPVLHTIDLSRQTLLWHQDFDPRTLVYTWFCGTAVFIVGWLVFRTSRLRRRAVGGGLTPPPGERRTEKGEGRREKDGTHFESGRLPDLSGPSITEVRTARPRPGPSCCRRRER
jgi:hypothetical protein